MQPPPLGQRVQVVVAVMLAGWLRLDVRGAAARGAVQCLHGPGGGRDPQLRRQMLRAAVAAACSLPARPVITDPLPRPACAPRSRRPLPLPGHTRGSFSPCSGQRRLGSRGTAAAVVRIPSTVRSEQGGSRGLAQKHLSGGARLAPAFRSPPTASPRGPAGSHGFCFCPAAPAERSCTRAPLRPEPGAHAPPPASLPGRGGERRAGRAGGRGRSSGDAEPECPRGHAVLCSKDHSLPSGVLGAPP